MIKPWIWSGQLRCSLADFGTTQTECLIEFKDYFVYICISVYTYMILQFIGLSKPIVKMHNLDNGLFAQRKQMCVCACMRVLWVNEFHQNAVACSTLHFVNYKRSQYLNLIISEYFSSQIDLNPQGQY